MGALRPECKGLLWRILPIGGIVNTVSACLVRLRRRPMPGVFPKGSIQAGSPAGNRKQVGLSCTVKPGRQPEQQGPRRPSACCSSPVDASLRRAPSPAESTTTAASPSATEPSGSASANGEPTAAPLPGPGDGPPPAAAPVIRWIPIGPAAPTDPPEGTLYELLRHRDCAGLRDSTLNTAFPAVWAAAEATCLALATDLPQDWQRAQTALAGVPSLPPGRCWEIKVTESLQQAVDLRTAHPGVQLLRECRRRRR